MSLDKLFNGERPTPELIQEKFQDIMGGIDTDARTVSEPTARMVKQYAEALELDRESSLRLIIVVQHFRLNRLLQALSNEKVFGPPVIAINDLCEKEVRKAWDEGEERLKNVENPTLKAKYNELIGAVQSAFPEETRHETALRYIEEAENRRYNQGSEDIEA